MAWLNTAPKAENKSLSNATDKTVTRLQQMQDEEADVPLPPCPARFLIDYLLEIGPVVPAGMGSAAIAWRDIAAWRECTAVDLPPWQAQLLRRLSADYLVMSRDAEKLDCPAPWLAEQDVEANRGRVRDKVRSLFGSLAGGRGRRI